VQKNKFEKCYQSKIRIQNTKVVKKKFPQKKGNIMIKYSLSLLVFTFWQNFWKKKATEKKGGKKALILPRLVV